MAAVRSCLALGLAGAAEGHSWQPGAGVPESSGRVAWTSDNSCLVQLFEPHPGLAYFQAVPMGDRAMIALRMYLYGPRSAEAADRLAPLWQAWFAPEASSG